MYLTSSFSKVLPLVPWNSYNLLGEASVCEKSYPYHIFALCRPTAKPKHTNWLEKKNQVLSSHCCAHIHAERVVHLREPDSELLGVVQQRSEQHLHAVALEEGELQLRLHTGGVQVADPRPSVPRAHSPKVSVTRGFDRLARNQCSLLSKC